MEHGQEIESIVDAKSLARFVARLAEEAGRPDNDWENVDLENFLKAMASWLSDATRSNDARVAARMREPTWRAVAEILWAATMYE